MATRALIGYLDNDGVLTTTYNHYDGYPDHLGKILDTYYSRNKRARDVANKGYISYFEDDGDIVSNNKRNPDKIELGRDLGTGDQLDWEDALLEMAKHIDDYGADYAYIWYEEDGDWSEIKNTGIRSMVDQLANQLASAATMYGPVDENKELKEENMNMILDKVKEIKPLFPGMDDKILVDFVKTHIEDIRGASDEDIKDEFEEFFSVNYETGADYMDEAIFTANEMGDKAVEDESASGAFEEAVNWRGETLKEQFKRLSK
jgi:hypothetical protein